MGLGSSQEAVGAPGQGDQGAGSDHLPAEAVILGLGAVADVDLVGLGQVFDLIDPGEKARVLRRTGHAKLLQTRRTAPHPPCPIAPSSSRRLDPVALGFKPAPVRKQTMGPPIVVFPVVVREKLSAKR